MSLFRTQNAETPKVYWASNWDERLYKALFAQTTETNLKIGHLFNCLLEERSTKIESNVSAPVHKYRGTFRLWLSETEYSEIPLQVSCEDSHEYFDLFINKFSLGFFSFFGQSPVGRPHVAMSITLRNESGLADHVAKLFAEVKAAGGKGLNISWSVILKDMVGLSADQVWGKCEEPVEYDQGGKRITAVPAGQQAFALESFSVEALL
jgi:hypothetical protein